MEPDKPGPTEPARTRSHAGGLRHLLTAALLLAAAAAAGAGLLARAPLREGVPLSSEVRGEDGRLTLAPASDGRYRVWRPLCEISPLLAEATEAGLGPRRALRWTLSRRVAELRYGGAAPLRRLRALWLRLAFSEPELLEAFLNLAPYGGQIAGAEAASFVYFDKHADQLTLSEALTLSVMPDRPLRMTLDGANRADQAARQAARRRLRQRLEKDRRQHSKMASCLPADAPSCWPRPRC